MRPRLLKMTAFGPYAGEQQIDFTCLEDANMFLIYGPTGGGKTTILDAICYALYGETNGGERSGEAMRSKFADEEAITQVELFFKLRQEEYQIIRRPQYERVAKRGNGGKLVKVASEVELYQKEEGSYKLLTAKYNEVGEKIVELLHFNIDQFRQVIMIAQNKFRKLLTVSSKERQQILQDIFETGIYQNVEKALELMYASSKDSLKEKQLLYENTLSNIEVEADDVLVDYLNTRVIHNAPEVCELLAQRCEEQAKEEQGASEALIALESEFTSSQQKLIKLNKQYEQVQEKEKCVAELKGLEEKAKDYEALEDQAKKAEKTLPIIPLEHIVMELKQDFLTHKKQVDDHQAQLVAIEEKLESQNKVLKENEKLPEEVEALKKAYNVLETYEPKVKQLEEKRVEKQKQEELLIKATDKYNGLVEDVDNLKKQILKEETQLKEKDKVQSQLNALILRQKEVGETLRLKEERDLKNQQAQKVFVDLEALQNKIDQQESLYKSYDQEYRQGFKLWITNQAGEIAKSLEENAPCPVCGSKVHPHRAVLSNDHISKEELEALEERNKKLERDILSLKENRSALEKECKLLKERLEEYDKSLEGKEAVNLEVAMTLAKEQALLEQQVTLLEKLQEQLENDKLNLEVRHKKKEAGVNYITEQKEKLSETSTYIISIENEVPKALLNSAQLEEKLRETKASYVEKETAYKRLQEEIEALNTQKTKLVVTLAEGKKHLASLSEQGAEKKKQLEKALEEADFKDLLDYKRYKMLPEQLDEAKKALNEYKQRKALLEDKLAELKLKTQEFLIEDLEQAKQINEELLNRRTTLSLKQNEAIKFQKKHRVIMAQLNSLYEEVKLMVKKQTVIEKISSLAKGKNKKGLSFERYIQSSIFEEVLRSANKKLRPMTHNRYELFRSDDLTRSNAQAGLDIGIKDYYNSETRAVNTLSGGESFMAALALALGLSEVIQRLAGATPLDTLFIDEGFGSLDEEALELAIKTLLSIQDTGRLIGIISHVKELREQIPVGLEVTTGAKGSFATFKL